MEHAESNQLEIFRLLDFEIAPMPNNLAISPVRMLRALAIYNVRADRSAGLPLRFFCVREWPGKLYTGTTILFFRDLSALRQPSPCV